MRGRTSALGGYKSKLCALRRPGAGLRKAGASRSGQGGAGSPRGRAALRGGKTRGHSGADRVPAAAAADPPYSPPPPSPGAASPVQSEEVEEESASESQIPKSSIHGSASPRPPSTSTPSPPPPPPGPSSGPFRARGFRGAVSSSRSSCAPSARFSRRRRRRRRCLSPVPPPLPPPPPARCSAARGWGGVRGRVSSPPSASPESSFLLLLLLLKRILWPQIATRLPPSVLPPLLLCFPPKVKRTRGNQKLRLAGESGERSGGRGDAWTRAREGSRTRRRGSQPSPAQSLDLRTRSTHLLGDEHPGASCSKSQREGLGEIAGRALFKAVET
ncbi:uncharacterized protein LOC128596947 [Nycticebus coucang]|uniref:uncharacterized protein LOC128596947 n=1 Tax=Nycticebus coucang TaxID=9470 RepID=UPI00234D7050|nr:uncharacterized protein LOC128596947 [Nycticebus coucang]